MKQFRFADESQTTAMLIQIEDNELVMGTIEAPFDEATEAIETFSHTVHMYKDETFEDWIEQVMGRGHLMSTITTGMEGGWLITIYDGGPFEQEFDVEMEIVSERGGNIGYAVQTAVPEFAEWTSVNAPRFGESDEEYTKRVNEQYAMIKDFLGPDAFLIDVENNKTYEGTDAWPKDPFAVGR